MAAEACNRAIQYDGSGDNSSKNVARRAGWPPGHLIESAQKLAIPADLTRSVKHVDPSRVDLARAVKGDLITRIVAPSTEAEGQ